MYYRWALQPGGCYFFTVNIADRDKTLLVSYIELLREVVRQVKLRHPFQIDAMVVLPEHLHAIWTLPEGDVDFSKRWGLIKANFSRGLAKNESISKSRMLKGERESGSEDIGSILFAMKRIIAGMWITSILIRLSMALLSGAQIGHIPVSIVMLPEAYYRLIGGRG